MVPFLRMVEAGGMEYVHCCFLGVSVLSAALDPVLHYCFLFYVQMKGLLLHLREKLAAILWERLVASNINPVERA